MKKGQTTAAAAIVRGNELFIKLAFLRLLGNHAVLLAYWPEAAQCSRHRAVRLGRCLGRHCPPRTTPAPPRGCAPRGELVIVVL